MPLYGQRLLESISTDLEYQRYVPTFYLCGILFVLLSQASWNRNNLPIVFCSHVTITILSGFATTSSEPSRSQSKKKTTCLQKQQQTLSDIVWYDIEFLSLWLLLAEPRLFRLTLRLDFLSFSLSFSFSFSLSFSFSFSFSLSLPWSHTSSTTSKGCNRNSQQKSINLVYATDHLSFLPCSSLPSAQNASRGNLSKPEIAQAICMIKSQKRPPWLQASLLSLTSSHDIQKVHLWVHHPLGNARFHS